LDEDALLQSNEQHSSYVDFNKKNIDYGTNHRIRYQIEGKEEIEAEIMKFILGITKIINLQRWNHFF
jgi:hypothetical protein